jgi:hypothetical protein
MSSPQGSRRWTGAGFRLTAAGIVVGVVASSVRFVNDHNGTATISGKPTKTGTYQLTLAATFGSGKTKDVVTQAFTLTVDPA